MYNRIYHRFFLEGPYSVIRREYRLFKESFLWEFPHLIKRSHARGAIEKENLFTSQSGNLPHDPPGHRSARIVVHTIRQLYRLKLLIKRNHLPQRVFPLGPSYLNRYKSQLQIPDHLIILEYSPRHPHRRRIRVGSIKTSGSQGLYGTLAAERRRRNSIMAEADKVASLSDKCIERVGGKLAGDTEVQIRRQAGDGDLSERGERKRFTSLNKAR